MSFVRRRTGSTASWKALTALFCALGCGDAQDATAKPGATPSGSAAATPTQAVAAAAATPTQAVVAAAAAAAATPRTNDHFVFDFVANRPLAHLSEGGFPVVVTGGAGFHKYLRFAKPKVSWTLGKTKEGYPGKVAIADGYANFDLPVTADQVAGATALHIRAFVAEKRKVAVKIGDKDAGSLELSGTGWQTISIPLAAGTVKAGENRFQLISGKAGTLTIAFMQLGGPAPDETPPNFFENGALALSKGEAAAWYIQVPEGGAVAADVTGAGCTLATKFEPSEGAALTGTLTGAGGAVDLSAAAGKIGRLTLTADGCARATFTGGLIRPGAAPTVKRDAKPKHVILMIQDSLRSDRVKPFWPKARPDVPNWEALAKTGTIFRNTYVQGNESRASHASIWSAVYPVNHKMIVDGAKLDAAKWVTLGEAMKKAGFVNHGESANGYIIAKWGFGEGWDSYQNHIHDGGGVRGDQVMDLGLKAIEKIRTKSPDKSWFLYLGLIDTHVSWRAKEPWISKYSPSYNGKYKTAASGQDVEAMAAGKLKITEADKEHIRAIYDSNVSYQDKLMGEMFERLKTWGVADDTMVVVTADHGDEQWEDVRVGHGASLRETLIRVPLMVHYPKLFPGGTVWEGADTVDILPTILDALGQPIPEDVQGESLLPIAQGLGQGYPRPSIASQYEFAHAMRLGEWKVRVGGSAVPMLFHVEKDPLEKTDLADKRPIERRFLTDVFSVFLVNQKAWKKTRWGVPSNLKPEFVADIEGK